MTAISISVNNMYCDPYGQVYFTQNEICDLLYTNPELDLSQFRLKDADQYNTSIKKLNVDFRPVERYQQLTIDIAEFDQVRQQKWLMPQEYQNLDIGAELLARCSSEIQKDRVRLELAFFEQNNLLDLVRYIKYLIDTMNQHNIVWGVGRGSSSASYVLYLLGLHMIDPIKYNIPLEEFFKKGVQDE